MELPKLASERGREDFGNLFLRAMRDIGKSRTRQKEYANKRLDTLFDASSYNHLTDEEQNNCDRNMTTVEDLMDYAKVLGEEGREEGKAERSIEIARTLLSLGVDIATIVKSTGLSEKEIKAL
ncbi:MAG: hypothetical protein MJY55_06985 [Bacteroidales bacterium]|nr:hypothetical protein [Bacteroidales bacterium]